MDGRLAVTATLSTQAVPQWLKVKFILEGKLMYEEGRIWEKLYH
jgi:hypothetical protein